MCIRLIPILVLLSVLPAGAQDRVASPPGTDAQAAPASDGVTIRILAPSAETRMTVFGSEDGMPRPSIILGAVPSEPVPDLGEVDLGEVAVTEIVWGDAAARTSLRRRDAQLHARLVASGAFDPPETELASALQGELARMGCYLGGMDGAWGAGSRASVSRYGQAGDGPPPSDAATVALWRHVIAREDVRCGAPAVAPVQVRAAPARSGSSPRAAASPPRSAPIAPPSPAPTTQAPRRGIGTAMGVFR